MKWLRALLIFSTIGSLTACSTLLNGKRWGEGATLTPGWERIREAAVGAIKSPMVWAPAAAAIVLQVDDMDERVSYWATEHTPVFGSLDNASDASDVLRIAGQVAYGATLLASPSGGASTKLKELGVGLAAIGMTGLTTSVLKDTTGRTRPNDGDDRSFPSGHVSLTAVASVLAARNVDHLQIRGWSRTTLHGALILLPFATSWARVEAGAHYPADVLAGIALGHFVGAFIDGAFLGTDATRGIAVTIEPSWRGVRARLIWSF